MLVICNFLIGYTFNGSCRYFSFQLSLTAMGFIPALFHDDVPLIRGSLVGTAVYPCPKWQSPATFTAEF